MTREGGTPQRYLPLAPGCHPEPPVRPFAARVPLHAAAIRQKTGLERNRSHNLRRELLPHAFYIGFRRRLLPALLSGHLRSPASDWPLALPLHCFENTSSPRPGWAAGTESRHCTAGLGAGGNNGPGLGRPTKRTAQYFLQSPHQGTLCCTAHSVSSKSDQVIWI